MPSATESRVSDLIISLVLRIAASNFSSSTAARMQRLGEAFCDIGDLAIPELVDLVTETTLETRCRQLEQAAGGAESLECPDYWRRALDRYRGEFLQHVATREFFVPIEFRSLGSVEAGYRGLRTFLGDFGRLITSWPALWEVARQVNSAQRAI
jgi:hypothetical protein